MEEIFDKTNKCIYRLTQNFKDGILQLHEIYYWNEDTDSLQLGESYKFDEEDNKYYLFSWQLSETLDRDIGQSCSF